MATINAINYNNPFPSFLWACNSAYSELTGEGTQFYYPWDYIYYSNNVTKDGQAVKIPVAGLMQFSWNIYISGIISANTTGYIQFQMASNYQYFHFNPYLLADSSGNVQIAGSAEFELAAGAGCLLTVAVGGNTSKNVGITSGNYQNTYFAGHLIR